MCIIYSFPFLFAGLLGQVGQYYEKSEELIARILKVGDLVLCLMSQPRYTFLERLAIELPRNVSNTNCDVSNMLYWGWQELLYLIKREIGIFDYTA